MAVVGVPVEVASSESWATRGMRLLGEVSIHTHLLSVGEDAPCCAALQAPSMSVDSVTRGGGGGKYDIRAVCTQRTHIHPTRVVQQTLQRLVFLWHARHPPAALLLGHGQCTPHRPMGNVVVMIGECGDDYPW